MLKGKSYVYVQKSYCQPELVEGGFVCSNGFDKLSLTDFKFKSFDDKKLRINKY